MEATLQRNISQRDIHTFKQWDKFINKEGIKRIVIGCITTQINKEYLLITETLPHWHIQFWNQWQFTSHSKEYSWQIAE